LRLLAIHSVYYIYPLQTEMLYNVFMVLVLGYFSATVQLRVHDLTEGMPEWDCDPNRANTATLYAV